MLQFVKLAQPVPTFWSRRMMIQLGKTPSSNSREASTHSSTGTLPPAPTLRFKQSQRTGFMFLTIGRERSFEVFLLFHTAKLSPTKPTRQALRLVGRMTTTCASELNQSSAS